MLSLSTTNEPVMKQWRPTIDVKETADKFLIQAELPGVKKEDIHVEYDNGLLTLFGEKKYEKVERDEQYHRVERSYGSFRRTFNLGEVDTKSVNATFKDGLLLLTIPKPKEQMTRSTKINIE